MKHDPPPRPARPARHLRLVSPPSSPSLVSPTPAAPFVRPLDVAEVARLRAEAPAVLARLADACAATSIRPELAPFAGEDGEVLLLACLGRLSRAGVPIPAAVAARARRMLDDDEAQLARVAAVAYATPLPDAVGSDFVRGVDWLRALAHL